ncbi:MAG: DUF4292 domain-containing protein [Bacteroidales bacterium]|nr:DUF4292 domain-containing protein [Bacteroidales bacterium]
MMKKIIYLLITVILFSSCSLFKKSGNDKKDKQTIEVKKDKKEKMKKEKPFETFSCKVSGSYKGIPVSATVRIAYDSIIWVSASSLGIEGVRALCLTDSLFAINKLEKEYIAVSYDRAEKFVGIPLSYNFVQSLLLDTVANTTFNAPNFAGKVTKEITKVENKYYFPSVINVDAVFNKEKQSIKLKVKNHKVNPVNDYPFSQPQGYKVRH